jgi:pimeloyl-ACP methyl ester carboxylesterase
MKQEFVRMSTVDGVEQPGILYTPDEETDKVVIHVHGLNGNFYENRFLDTLAKVYTNNNYAFLTFNNRGRDFIAELLKGDEFTIIGGSLERFKDCLLDIEGVINWVKERNYKEIILEGHSYGCNKVLYYYHHKKDEYIKKIVLLAPCDIPSEVKMFLGEEELKIAKEESTRLVNEGKENELIDFSIMANGKIAAGTFYFDFLPGGENDFIKYCDGVDGKSTVLNDIDVPVSIIFGSEDVCVLTEPVDIVKAYLKNNISNAQIHVIEGVGHSYAGKYEDLGEIIEKNVLFY